MSDEFASLFAPEPAPQEAQREAWKVLLVDDEADIHAVLRLALRDVRVENRPLSLLEAKSGEAAKQQLTEHPDIALILLDVVMETEQAGLDLVHYIRHELDNHLILIVVVTGQPGYAPQREVIVDYEIDGYRLKSELTADKIFVSVYTALRTYQALYTLGRKSRQLEESEQRYADLYDHAPDMYVSVDAATALIRQCNHTLADKLNYRKEEIVGRPIFELYHPDCMPAVQQAFHSFVTNGEVHNAELQLMRKDGSKIDVNLNVTAVRDEDGKILYSRSCWIDISERKRIAAELELYRNHLEDLVAERTAELREAETRYRTVADYTYAWETWIDTQGAWIYCSPSCERITGHRAEEFIADPKLFVEIIHPEDQPAMLSHLADQHCVAGELSEFSYRVIRPDGEIVWLEHVCQPVFDAKGKHLGQRASNRDITDRVQAEEALRQARDAAEAANRAKSVFLANMSHELRTPLNAILGFAQLMSRDAGLSVEQYKNLDIINRAGEHLLTMINDVLDLSKIEAGKIELSPDVFDLPQMFRDVADMFRMRAQAKSLGFELDMRLTAVQHVKADQHKLRQILINLLGNALKFTRQGEISLHAECTAIADSSTQAMLHVTVQDSGVGIPAKELEAIFQPFVQAKSYRNHQGTGLGLAISRAFIELMQGSIRAESTLHKGSRFCFEIPLEIPNLPAAGELSQSIREVVGLEEGHQEWRILVADDEIMNRGLLESLLKKAGFDVKTSADGAEAIAVFQVWSPHFIWLDIRMPEMDGCEVVKRIRALPGGQDVKVAAVTAGILRTQKEELLGKGFDDMVSKPYQTAEIFKVMAKHLDLRYVYAQPRQTSTPAHHASLHEADLAKLPQELLKNLLDAVLYLDMDKIRTVVDSIHEREPAVADAIQQLSEEFHYEKLMELCEKVLDK